MIARQPELWSKMSTLQSAMRCFVWQPVAGDNMQRFDEAEARGRSDLEVSVEYTGQAGGEKDRADRAKQLSQFLNAN
jgi:hypothetical protein